MRKFVRSAGCLAIVGGLAALSASSTAGAAQGGAANDPAAREWVQLFNGRDLTGWTPKFSKHPLGENLHNTVRVEDGLLKIRYDGWTKFDGEFGHIFYREPYSHYIIAAEYRFVGQQVAGGADWAIRNNGLMLHAPDPKTMLLDQDFPISIEVQLLGGLGNGQARSTANLCTPGSNVVMNGKLHTAHCTNSSSKTYDGDQWVRVEVEVHGGERMRHFVDGQVVLEYTGMQMGGGAVAPVDPAIKIDGTPMTSGFISIQAETAPTDFRKIELLNLEGCMNPAASNYKSYYVKSKPEVCR